MLVQLSNRVFVHPGGVNIGVVRIDDRHCLLIDTGLNETSAKKVLRAVGEELAAEVAAIVTTHGHADHFGGNATVVKRTGATVYAPTLDEVFLRYPILQPAFLYGGADPIDSMRTNFMVAASSPVDVVYESGSLEIDSLDVEVVSLAGHSANQMGTVVDGVFFAADVVLPEPILDKYRIPYLFSVTDHLQALERCGQISAARVVPGHGPVLEEITPLRDLNRGVVLETAELIVDFCDQPRTSGEIMKRVLDGRGANVADSPGYYLLQPTINAYLAHLTRTGALSHDVSANQSSWMRV